MSSHFALKTDASAALTTAMRALLQHFMPDVHDAGPLRRFVDHGAQWVAGAGEATSQRAAEMTKVWAQFELCGDITLSARRMFGSTDVSRQYTIAFVGVPVLATMAAGCVEVELGDREPSPAVVLPVLRCLFRGAWELSQPWNVMTSCVQRPDPHNATLELLTQLLHGLQADLTRLQGSLVAAQLRVQIADLSREIETLSALQDRLVQAAQQPEAPEPQALEADSIGQNAGA